MILAGLGQRLILARYSIIGMCCALHFRGRKIDRLSVGCGRLARSLSCVKDRGTGQGGSVDHKINRSLQCDAVTKQGSFASYTDSLHTGDMSGAWGVTASLSSVLVGHFSRLVYFQVSQIKQCIKV